MSQNRQYELIYVVSSDATDQQIADLHTQVEEIVAREFAALATSGERLALLRCLFAVSAADESVAVREDNEIRQISRELRIEHADFIAARAEVRQHLAVLGGRQSSG